MNKILNKRNMYLLFIFVIVLSFYSINTIYAKFEQGFTTDDNIVDYNYDLNFDITPYSDDSSVSTIEEYEVVDVMANGYVIFNVDVKNSNNYLIYYGIWYKNLSDIYTDISVGKYISYANDTFGSLRVGETKTTTIVIKNNEDINVKVKIGVASDKDSLDNIGYFDNRKLISDVISNVNSDNVNEPVLSGDMIPVVYNEDKHCWVKADYTNKNNSWYDYYNKKWANVVLVKNNVRNNYVKANVGSNINIDDVLAFYVWIPRFKYMVWDINRQTKSFDNYSYKVREKGIGIIFESDGENSGNVKCSYNFSSSELVDECEYMNNKVNINSLNSVYADAWYTHPAFVRGDKNLSGFWIGKFETTGNKDTPTILPDKVSLTNFNIVDYYNISKKFNNYGIGDELESRVIRNVEWGAVSYLTNSIYGLCSEFGCTDSYVNNSYDHYTGRSSGSMISGEVSQYGTYSYDGYEMNENNKGNKFNYEVIASSTSNISGVYDMAGGALEYVMANVSDKNNKFNEGILNDVWENNKIDSTYYDLYSSFSSLNDSYYKSILGDATAEVSINDTTWGNSMKTNINDDYAWIVRGNGNTIFGYEYVDGGFNSIFTFRSVISQ